MTPMKAAPKVLSMVETTVMLENERKGPGGRRKEGKRLLQKLIGGTKEDGRPGTTFQFGEVDRGRQQVSGERSKGKKGSARSVV